MTVLVAGIGNVFQGDDGFGVEVARRLLAEPESLPAGVRAADYGIRGVHLAYELLNGYDALVLIDALPQGGVPGTVYVFKPDPVGPPSDGPGPVMDAHDMNPQAVLGHVRALGGVVDRVVVVGCEPADVTDRMGLSPAVEAAVGPAVDTVREVAAELVAETDSTERV
ncbi:MAG TPA: hydrogenase maturation protease [Planosporangium sp.]|jgi:hydrogenase maturation protease|nr:hydrogenase maturation protease [Planosporangium sp.]